MRVRSDDGGLVLDDLAEGVTLAAAAGRVEVRDLCGTLEVREPGGQWKDLLVLIGTAGQLLWTAGPPMVTVHDPRCVLHGVGWIPACAAFNPPDLGGELCATCGHFRGCHG